MVPVSVGKYKHFEIVDDKLIFIEYVKVPLRLSSYDVLVQNNYKLALKWIKTE